LLGGNAAADSAQAGKGRRPQEKRSIALGDWGVRHRDEGRMLLSGGGSAILTLANE